MTTLTDTVPEITYADSVAVSGIVSLLDLSITHIDSAGLGFNGVTTLKDEKILSSIPIDSVGPTLNIDDNPLIASGDVGFQVMSYLIGVGAGGGGGGGVSDSSGGGGASPGSQSIELIIY